MLVFLVLFPILALIFGFRYACISTIFCGLRKTFLGLKLSNLHIPYPCGSQES